MRKSDEILYLSLSPRTAFVLLKSLAIMKMYLIEYRMRVYLGQHLLLQASLLELWVAKMKANMIDHSA